MGIILENLDKLLFEKKSIQFRVGSTIDLLNDPRTQLPTFKKKSQKEDFFKGLNQKLDQD